MHDATDTTDRCRRTWHLLTGVLLVAFVAAIVRLSWLCDDAFITFRSVENVQLGHGPVWNVDERVQTYTHPLWFWLLCLVRWLTGECQLSAQWLGIGLSTAFAVAITALLGRASAAVAALALLLGSRAWACYATSGLETSLSALLLAMLFFAARRSDPARRLLATALVTSLLATNRLDLLLLGVPVVVASLRAVPPRRALGLLTLGFAPLALWSAFAAVYYGSPFPVTAYAKAFCPGLPAGELAAQGLRYLLRSLTDDPVTPAVIGLGIAAGFACRGHRAFALGALLYSAYVVKVGGDYMLGRFWVPPFVVTAVLLAHAGRGPRAAAVMLLATAALAFVPGVPPALLPRPTEDTGHHRFPDDGISDEQAQAYWATGLLSPGAGRSQPGELGAALRARGITRRAYVVAGWIGWSGFTMGPQVHVIDPWLCDPLLMRLPVTREARWRPGHFLRRMPDGYLESLARGENRIPHEGLRRYYEALRSVVRDPVWSSARLAHLFALWTGRLDAGLADYLATEYHTPPRLDVPWQEITAPVPPGAFWFDAPGGHTAQAGGLELRLPAPSTARTLELLVSGDADYRVRFRRDGATLGEGIARQPVPLGEPMATARLAVPADVGTFDTLWIDAPVDPWQPAAAFVGRVSLLD